MNCLRRVVSVGLLIVACSQVATAEMQHEIGSWSQRRQQNWVTGGEIVTADIPDWETEALFVAKPASEPTAAYWWLVEESDFSHEYYVLRFRMKCLLKFL